MVGLWHSVSAQAAVAPIRQQVKIQMSAQAYSKIAIARQWRNPFAQYICLNTLWTHESHWNPKAANPHSTAFGIPQFLDTTWVNYHYPVRPTDPLVQVTAGLRYITVRYGSPCRAWSFWYRHNYY